MPPISQQTTAFLPSLRDPAGQVFEMDGRILRVVRRSAVPCVEAALSSSAVRHFIENRNVVETWKVHSEEKEDLLRRAGPALSMDKPDIGYLLEHRRIPFVSYPYEWAPEMLHRAAELTLELAEVLLPEGMGIKDATPYNVLFDGSNPVFSDFLSFEKREPRDPLWRAGSQFASSFLNPILVNKYFGLPLHFLLFNRREGLAPGEVYPLCGPVRRWTPPFLNLVTVPTLLSSRRQATNPGLFKPRYARNHEKAAFILEALYRRKKRALKALAPLPNRTSFWAGYMDQGFPHTPEQLRQKEVFLRSALEKLRPKRLLDVGCNTGHFSALAAKSRATVVAIDSDPTAVGRTWRKAQSEGLDILPLVVNFASPSPGAGWTNAECPSFLQRAHGYFDVVLMFAVVHHLLVTDGIPIREILGAAARLTKETLILEYVSPEDEAFQKLAKLRDYSYLKEDYFEAHFQPHFQVVRKERTVSGHRCLYLLRKTDFHG